MRSRTTPDAADERARASVDSVGERTGAGDAPAAERAQTTIDFAIGISVFLLAVAFAFALLPSLFVPFNAPIDDDLTTRADRVAVTAISDLSTEGNALDPDRTADRFDPTNRTEAALRSSFGLPASTRVNVTVTDPGNGTVAEPVVDGERLPPLRAGAERGDHPTAASSRIATIGDDAYQFTVYLW